GSVGVVVVSAAAETLSRRLAFVGLGGVGGAGGVGGGGGGGRGMGAGGGAGGTGGGGGARRGRGVGAGGVGTGELSWDVGTGSVGGKRADVGGQDLGLQLRVQRREQGRKHSQDGNV